MKISYAILSSDSSSLYLDFWPIVSEIWFKKFGIQPILIFIDNDLDKIIDETYGKVFKIKPIEDQPLHLQNQIVRFWFPIHFENEVSIISDIDMLPISLEYFNHQIANRDNDSYLHLNPCIDTYGRLPACYHVASGKLFKNILEIEEDWISFYFKVLNKGTIICKNDNLPIWFCDEAYTSNKVISKLNEYKISLLKRNGGQNGYRIDRANWKYNQWLLNYDYYYDLHSVRPLNDHKKEILEIKNSILKSKNKKPFKIEILCFKIIWLFIRKTNH